MNSIYTFIRTRSTYNEDYFLKDYEARRHYACDGTRCQSGWLRR